MNGELHWLSGWFSGGGCVSIRGNTVRIEGSSCDRGLLRHVKGIAGGGKIYQRPSDKRSGNRKQLYRWQLAGDQAVELLTKLKPHLVGRRHHAKIAAAQHKSGNKVNHDNK